MTKIKEINSKEVCDILNEIMEYELAGVVRYTSLNDGKRSL